MKRSKFNELKIHFKFCYAKGFIKPFFSSPGEGFPGLPQELIMQQPCSLNVPVSGRQGGQLSTKSLAEDKMWSGFQTPNVWGPVCAMMTLEI